jgi:hypothetical protein
MRIAVNGLQKCYYCIQFLHMALFLGAFATAPALMNSKCKQIVPTWPPTHLDFSMENQYPIQKSICRGGLPFPLAQQNN